jgi:hypothetical protein
VTCAHFLVADGAVTARRKPTNGFCSATIDSQAGDAESRPASNEAGRNSEGGLVAGFAPSRLRMELDRVPLWRGDHVAIRQLVEDFARYLYLPRLKEPAVLLEAIRDGLRLLTWSQDSFAYAESFDDAAGRYRGLRCGELVNISEDSGLLVRPEVALKQHQAETAPSPSGFAESAGGVVVGGPVEPVPTGGASGAPGENKVRRPKRFHGSVSLDPSRVGRDAGRIADEVISHLAGLVGSSVKVTLEIEAEVQAGTPENVVRTVTENSRTLKFDPASGFEEE